MIDEDSVKREKLDPDYGDPMVEGRIITPYLIVDPRSIPRPSLT